VNFRETRLGGCTKRGPCEYGGIESVARCAGGDGDKPCRDGLFDKNKAASIRRQLDKLNEQFNPAEPQSPRQRALRAEAAGLTNYLHVVGNLHC